MSKQLVFAYLIWNSVKVAEGLLLFHEENKSSQPEIFLKISQNLQRKTCVYISFLHKVVGVGPATLFKKGSDIGVFL